MRARRIFRETKLLCMTTLWWNHVMVDMCVSSLVMSDSVTPWTVASQAPLFMGVLKAGILEWLLCPLPRELPNPGIKPRSLSLQVNSLLSESPGKPKSIGAGSLSVLQGIFLTQESNRGLLHCRLILYQLSYQFSSVQFSHSVMSNSP